MCSLHLRAVLRGIGPRVLARYHDGRTQYDRTVCHLNRPMRFALPQAGHIVADLKAGSNRAAETWYYFRLPMQRQGIAGEAGLGAVSNEPDTGTCLVAEVVGTPPGWVTLRGARRRQRAKRCVVLHSPHLEASGNIEFVGISRYVVQSSRGPH